MQTSQLWSTLRSPYQWIMNLRLDWIEHWYVWLKTNLRLRAICGQIHAQILENARNPDLFDEHEIACYANLEPQDFDPLRVVTIKKYLKIIKDIEDLANSVEVLDVRSDRFTLPLLYDLLNGLFTKIDTALRSVHDLNQTSGELNFILEPVFSQLVPRVTALKQTLQAGTQHVQEFHALNENTFSRMLPPHQNGLSYISQGIVLLPEIIRELTELVKQGDPKIDFDPESPMLQYRMRKYERKLRDFSSNNRLIQWRGTIDLIALLIEKSNETLKAAAELSEESTIKSMALLDQIHHDDLPLIIAELEQVEEHLGLKTGLLTTPMLTTLEPYFNTVREKTHQLHTVSQVVRSAQQQLVWTALMGAPRNLQPAPISFMDDQFQSELASHRAKRWAKTQIAQEKYQNDRDAAMEFFATLQRHTSFISLKQLPPNEKARLISLYQRIQAHVALVDAQLDALLVDGLNAEQESRWSFDMMVAPFIAAPILQAINVPDPYYLTTGLCTLAWKKTREYFSDLNRLSTYKDAVLTHMAQTYAQTQHVALQLDQRDPTLARHPDVRHWMDELRQPVAHGEVLVEYPYHQHQINDLFGHIQALNLSASIQNFLDHTFLSFINNNLDRSVANKLLVTNAQGELVLPSTPYPESEFHQDEDIVIVYKHLINACIHLKTCLARLEKLNDRDRLSAMTIDRHFSTVEFLYATLYDGVQAYLKLQEACKNPLIQKSLRQNLNDLRVLENLPVIGPWLQTKQVLQPTPEPTCNAQVIAGPASEEEKRDVIALKKILVLVQPPHVRIGYCTNDKQYVESVLVDNSKLLERFDDAGYLDYDDDGHLLVAQITSPADLYKIKAHIESLGVSTYLTYHAYQNWQQQQDLREQMLANRENSEVILNRLNQQRRPDVAPEPEMIPPVPVAPLEPPAEEPHEGDIAEVLVPEPQAHIQGLIKQLHQIQQNYERLNGVHPDPLAPAQIEVEVQRITNEFFTDLETTLNELYATTHQDWFKNLLVRFDPYLFSAWQGILVPVYDYFFPPRTAQQAQHTISEWVNEIKRSSTLSNISTLTMPHLLNAMRDVPVLLRLIEQATPLLTQKFQEHKGVLTRHLNRCLTTLHAKILLNIDENEFNAAIVPGTYSGPTHDQLNAYKQQLIDLMPDTQREIKLNLSTDHTVWNFRLDAARAQRQQIHHAIDDTQRMNAEIQTVFEKFKSTYDPVIITPEILNFEVKIKLFCRFYQSLQPDLMQIDAKYNQDDYLRDITDEHQLKRAWVDIIQLKDKLTVLHEQKITTIMAKISRIQHRQDYLNEALDQERAIDRQRHIHFAIDTFIANKKIKKKPDEVHPSLGYIEQTQRFLGEYDRLYIDCIKQAIFDANIPGRIPDAAELEPIFAQVDTSYQPLFDTLLYTNRLNKLRQHEMETISEECGLLWVNHKPHKEQLSALTHPHYIRTATQLFYYTPATQHLQSIPLNRVKKVLFDKSFPSRAKATAALTYENLHLISDITQHHHQSPWGNNPCVRQKAAYLARIQKQIKIRTDYISAHPHESNNKLHRIEAKRLLNSAKKECHDFDRMILLYDFLTKLHIPAHEVVAAPKLEIIQYLTQRLDDEEWAEHPSAHRCLTEIDDYLMHDERLAMLTEPTFSFWTQPLQWITANFTGQHHQEQQKFTELRETMGTFAQTYQALHDLAHDIATQTPDNHDLFDEIHRLINNLDNERLTHEERLDALTKYLIQPGVQDRLYMYAFVHNHASLIENVQYALTGWSELNPSVTALYQHLGPVAQTSLLLAQMQQVVQHDNDKHTMVRRLRATLNPDNPSIGLNLRFSHLFALASSADCKNTLNREPATHWTSLVQQFFSVLIGFKPFENNLYKEFRKNLLTAKLYGPSTFFNKPARAPEPAPEDDADDNPFPPAAF